WRAVEIKKLTLDVVGFFSELVYRAPRVFCFAAGEFHVSLLSCIRDNFLSLLDGQGVLKGIAVGRAHVVHADGCNGFHARVDLGRADGEAPAATYPENTDPAAINKGASAEEIHGRAEILGIDV